LVDWLLRDAWLVADPIRPLVLWAQTEIGLYRTTDGARSWHTAERGLPGKMGFGEPGATLVVDPNRPDTAYIAAGGVFKTTDGGKRWRRAWHGPSVEVLAIDPKHPRTLYAGGTEGLYKTTDGGSKWRPLGVLTGLAHPHALAVDPQKPSTLYAYAYGGGVFKSTDSGHNWNLTGEGLPSGLGPARGGHNLFVDSARSVYVLTGDGRVFRSTDRGASWHELPVAGGGR
jgi:photosystem II stability/assembly factor-like uncharacterized protein